MYIVISQKLKKNKNCTKIKIIFFKNLEEKGNEIFESKECKNPNSAKISFIQAQNNNYLLLTSHAGPLWNDLPDLDSQDNKTIYGKVIKINLKNFNYEIFSKGHRNISGLYSDEKVILSTEHGPRGGDEINNLKYKNNYGWDIATYGTTYRTKKFYSPHAIYNFTEPVLAFIPSIGISEIEKIKGNEFSKAWQENFLLASLNYKHIIRLKFDVNFERVIFREDIYIGERVRDIKIIETMSLIVLSTSEGNLIFLRPIKTMLK